MSRTFMRTSHVRTSSSCSETSVPSEAMLQRGSSSALLRSESTLTCSSSGNNVALFHSFRAREYSWFYSTCRTRRLVCPQSRSGIRHARSDPWLHTLSSSRPDSTWMKCIALQDETISSLPEEAQTCHEALTHSARRDDRNHLAPSLINRLSGVRLATTVQSAHPLSPNISRCMKVTKRRNSLVLEPVSLVRPSKRRCDEVGHGTPPSSAISGPSSSTRTVFSEVLTPSTANSSLSSSSPPSSPTKRNDLFERYNSVCSLRKPPSAPSKWNRMHERFAQQSRTSNVQLYRSQELRSTDEDVDHPARGSGGGGNVDCPDSRFSSRKGFSRRDLDLLHSAWDHRNYYPSSAEVALMMRKTGLNRIQIRGWFANRRQRAFGGEKQRILETARMLGVNGVPF